MSILETNTIVSFQRVKDDVQRICSYLQQSDPHLRQAAKQAEALREAQLALLDVVKELVQELESVKSQLDNRNTHANAEPIIVERQAEPVVIERTVPKYIVRQVPKVVVKRVPKIVVRRVVKTKVVRSKRRLVASKTGGKVHNKHCAFAKQIKRKNKTIFNSIAYAHDKGYRDCACVA